MSDTSQISKDLLTTMRAAPRTLPASSTKYLLTGHNQSFPLQAGPSLASAPKGRDGGREAILLFYFCFSSSFFNTHQYRQKLEIQNPYQPSTFLKTPTFHLLRQ